MIELIFTLFLVIVLLVFLALIVYRSGTRPRKKRLESMWKSVNYSSGRFVNPVPTAMKIPPFKVIKEMMKKNQGRIPSASIITFPVDQQKMNEEPSVTWLGHSSFVLFLNGINVFIDPVFGKRASLFRFIGPKCFDYTHRFTADNLPEADVVLISHDHYDHLDFNAIQQLKKKAKCFVVPLGVGAHLEFWGVAPGKIVELNWWENYSYEGIRFTATPSRHFSGRGLFNRFKTLWCGWAIKSEACNLFFSGDSGYFGGFKTIGERLGPFDLSMVECGQYSRYWPEIHMMPEESAQAALDLKSKMAMPIHWGKFKLSIHAWNEPPQRFLTKAEAQGLKAVIPPIGQTFYLSDPPQEKTWFNEI